MIQPDFLKKGDTIGIISPAGIIEENCFKTGVETLKKAGFSVKKGNHVIEKWNKFAGKDEERASDLINMIKDASVKAILCSRGGYGTMRIIEKTDFNTFKNHPKWIIGFSDITTLHNICHNLAIQSIHGPMCKHLQDKESLNSLLNILTGQENTLHLPSHQFNKEGITEGIIVGGNLSIMNSLLCTPYDIDLRGKILFIEDTGEYLYRIDRMMMQLHFTGKLTHLNGLVVGYMSEMKSDKQEYGFTAYKIIHNILKHYDFPVAYNFPAGHQTPNHSIRLGSKIKLQVKKEEALVKYL